MTMNRGRDSPELREQRLRALHADAFDDLLRFTERRVPASEAPDVVSTVFLTAWRRLDDVPTEPGAARAWLFAVARNTMANQSRSWLRRRALDVRLADHWSEAGPDEAGATADRVDLARAFRSLSAADREVLALVAFDGLTADQAAQVLNCRRSTFAMRLTRARQRLRTALGDSAVTSSLKDHI
ncbi:RNA polymerase sigma factor [Kineosporia babensis]